MKKGIISKFAAPLVLLSSVNVSAGLVIEEFASGTPTPDSLGGWTLVDIGDTGASGDTNSIASGAFSGNILFRDRYSNPMDLYREDTDALPWWNNPETTNNEAFLTSEYWVELVLPENTRALTFNVGANRYSSGWAIGFSDDDLSSGREYFNLSPGSTPGIGIYADNSGGECSSISSVVIDPIFIWGFGNLSISQSDSCTPVSVPEPGVVTLLGLGLVGLGLARRRA